MMLASLLALTPFTTGIFFLRGVRPDGEISLMGLVQQIGLGHLMFAGLAARVLRPHISGPYGRNVQFLRKLRRFSLTFFFLLLIAGTAGSYILIYGFLSPVFRSAFHSAVFMVAASSITFLAMVAASYLVDDQRETAVLWTDVGVTILFVSLAWLFSKHVGYQLIAPLTFVVAILRTILFLGSQWMYDRTKDRSLGFWRV